MPKYDDSKDADIRLLYERGWTSERIGKLVGVSHTCVIKHLEHMGIKRRDRVPPEERSRRLDVKMRKNGYKGF